MRQSPVRITFLLLVALSVTGCGGGPLRVKVPGVSPDRTAQSAIEQFDSDGDGQLSKDEANNCPALLHAFGRYDKDNDGAVTADEIAARIEQLFGGNVGMFTCGCTVKLNGRPLKDAEVKLIPEACFGDAIKPASATTRETGRGMFTIAAADLPSGLQGVRGINAGLYRVEITHPKISLPAKYNTETTLGREVSQDDQIRGLIFDLKGG